jgi:hypothetical protein
MRSSEKTCLIKIEGEAITIHRLDAGQRTRELIRAVL